MNVWIWMLALSSSTAAPETSSALAAGCAKAGERLTACSIDTVAWSGTDAVDVVSCAVQGDADPREARTALVTNGKRVGCLSLREPVALADTWSVAKEQFAADSLGAGGLAYSSRRHSSAKLLFFFGRAYASSFNEVEIWRFVGGKAVQVLRPTEIGLSKLEDVDGDSVPELLAASGGCQTNCCYNPTVIYRLGATGFLVDEDASRERARVRGESWLGPTAADGDPANAYVRDCQERLFKRAEGADRVPK